MRNKSLVESSSSNLTLWCPLPSPIPSPKSQILFNSFWNVFFVGRIMISLLSKKSRNEWPYDTVLDLDRRPLKKPFLEQHGKLYINCVSLSLNFFQLFSVWELVFVAFVIVEKNVFRQTSVQWPPSWPKNSGRCWQVDINIQW